MILDGKMVSDSILSETSARIERHIETSKETIGYTVKRPAMAIVIVGSNPASETYVRAKMKACEKSGIDSKLIRFDENITAYDLLTEVKQLNKSHFDGFIVQLPLPSHIDADGIINEISAYKDIDGFHPLNFGKMSIGHKAMRPATPYGILKLLQYYQIETRGKKVVVIGRSNLVGKPISIMLGNDFEIGRATVTSCDINTPKELLDEETRRADIVIVAVGKRNILTEDMIKEGAVVIDVGINRDEDGRLCGDVDFENVSNKAGWITPVPGGVGPMTVAGLILNTYESWKSKYFINE
jgi:methylenetetrahydrofolate dehydrogenase (NADP+) / methenyltetrahydrofolate cyclohydrolase